MSAGDPALPGPRARAALAGRFAGKVALVTGASHGIGHAVALELLREGAAVVASALPADEAAGRAAFAAAGFSPLIVCGDLSDEAFPAALVAAAVGAHGGLDLLVNNAFSFLSRGVGASRADWERAFGVGPFAFAALMSLVAPLMAERGGASALGGRGWSRGPRALTTPPSPPAPGGSIVNVGSISCHIAQPDRWTYNAAKGAVLQMTRCAALDLGPLGVRVNCVSPGWTWTREVDKACGGDRASKADAWGAYAMLGRLAHTVEVARPVLFLLSDDASFITGADLDVSGGYLGLGPEGLGAASVFASTR